MILENGSPECKLPKMHWDDYWISIPDDQGVSDQYYEYEFY